MKKLCVMLMCLLGVSGLEAKGPKKDTTVPSNFVLKNHQISSDRRHAIAFYNGLHYSLNLNSRDNVYPLGFPKALCASVNDNGVVAVLFNAGQLQVHDESGRKEAYTINGCASLRSPEIRIDNAGNVFLTNNGAVAHISGSKLKEGNFENFPKIRLNEDKAEWERLKIAELFSANSEKEFSHSEFKKSPLGERIEFSFPKSYKWHYFGGAGVVVTLAAAAAGLYLWNKNKAKKSEVTEVEEETAESVAS